MLIIVMSAFHPKSCIVPTMSSSCSDVVKYTTFSSFAPAAANCFAKRSNPAPGGDVASTVNPFGIPFVSARSRAGIPVDAVLATALALHPDRLVAHQVHHVPDVVRLVLGHGIDQRVRLLVPEVVHEDVEELAQELRVVVDREAVDAVEEENVPAIAGLPAQVLDLEHEVLEHRRRL